MNYSSFAKKYIGIKQGSADHKDIIDGYNKIRPLPRSYKVTYNDSWCAAFVSYVLKMCNAKNPPYECSCYYMKQLAISNNQIVTSPKVNDLVIYDWNNNGTLDHVGIISKISGNMLTVIEGNKSKCVGTRNILKTSKDINCFIRVSQKTEIKNVSRETNDEIVNAVIRGDYGNGEERKKQLEKKGYSFSEVQKAVNKKLKEGV